MADDDIIILNQPLRSRTSKGGKQRYTVNVSSEPLIHNFDPSQMGAPVAEAIAEALRQKVRGITANAAASTLRARKVAAKAFSEGKTWAMKRFAGGRTGPTPPNQSDKAFNDSGRLAGSIVARANDKEKAFTINIAANRLDDTTSGGAVRIFRQLVNLVPEFGDPRKLMEDQGVQRAVETSIGMLITKARETREQLLEARARALLGTIRQVLGAVG